MKKITTLALLIISIAMAHSQSLNRPNIIIFIADDVSWDDFGCYGNSNVKTPNIDNLAQSAVRFDRAFLTASSCSPSRNSIMTGRYPHNTGAAELHLEPPLEMISFPELLRNHGYYSLQAGKFHMGKYAERGFEVIYRKSEETGNGGEFSWVKSIKERPKDKPFFMWFAAHDAHRDWGQNEFSGTHDPEDIIPPFYLADGPETKKDLAQYYDEIARFDHYIGEVVNELTVQEVLNNTLILIMADNGRPFPHSKTRVNDRGMQTPLIIYWPDKIKKSSISNSLISAIDIAPTVLTLAGVDLPGSIQGVSFHKLLENPDLQFRSKVFSEHNWHDYQAYERMVRTDQFLYIFNARPMQPQSGPADAVGSPSYSELNTLRAADNLTAVQTDIFITPRPKEELYDLTQDPLQLSNIASNPQYQESLERMRTILKNWQDQTDDDIPDQLTPDWYTREPGYVKTRQHGVRGEMPGSRLNAVNNNHKGSF